MKRIILIALALVIVAFFLACNRGETMNASMSNTDMMNRMTADPKMMQTMMDQMMNDPKMMQMMMDRMMNDPKAVQQMMETMSKNPNACARAMEQLSKTDTGAKEMMARCDAMMHAQKTATAK